MAELTASRDEILRRARRIEIKSRRLANRALAGEYRSVFRGTGIEFDSVREYTFGDDVRAIDWNVTARAGRPFVKRFREARERAVLLAVDRSQSLDFFAVGARSKATVAAEVAAVLALAAVRERDRVGLALFTRRIETWLRPERSAAWPHRILYELLRRPPRHRVRTADTERALTELSELAPPRAVVFIVSDFRDPLPRRPLARLSSRHDVVAIRVADRRELELDGAGIVECVDPETGRAFDLDAADEAERRRFSRASLRVRERANETLMRAGVDRVDLYTDADLLPPLLRFFARRGRRR